jgi:uncharacterized protein (TIGR02996 family)
MSPLEILQSLVQNVLEHPEEDSPRLVYADCLEEMGQVERAEFIRVQLEFERLHNSRGCGLRKGKTQGCNICVSKKGLRIRRREKELLKEDGLWNNLFDRYFSTLEGQGFWIGDSCFHAVFRRGFVDEIHCACAHWLHHGKAIVRQQPVRMLRFSDVHLYVEWTKYWPRNPIPKSPEEGCSIAALIWAQTEEIE